MKSFLVFLLAALPAAIVAQTSTTASAASTTTPGLCVAHDDHWDCPSGVPTPTIAPHDHDDNDDQDHDHNDDTPDDHAHEDDHDDDHDHSNASVTTCAPHGDHWHCPSGVAVPTTPPGPAQSATAAATSATTSATSAAVQPTGAAVRGREVAGAVVVGAFGALFV